MNIDEALAAIRKQTKDRKEVMDTLPKREWVGLTDEERDAIISKVIGFNSCCGWEDDYAIAIESKLKEKNHAN